MKYFKISELGGLVGFTAVSIRHYEKIGLLKPIRSASGYRLYNQSDIEKLRFIQNAKNAGLTLKEIKQIFKFLQEPRKKSLVIKELVSKKLEAIDAQLDSLQKTKKTLADLAKICSGKKSLEKCPILIHMFKKNQ